MKTKRYEAEETWLKEFLHYCGEICVSSFAEAEMRKQNVTLPDILCVLREPSIVAYEREWDGCTIIVKGRTCDDEEITVFGGFNSGIMSVSVSNVSRTRWSYGRDVQTQRKRSKPTEA